MRFETYLSEKAITVKLGHWRKAIDEVIADMMSVDNYEYLTKELDAEKQANVFVNLLNKKDVFRLNDINVRWAKGLKQVGKKTIDGGVEWANDRMWITIPRPMILKAIRTREWTDVINELLSTLNHESIHRRQFARNEDPNFIETKRKHSYKDAKGKIVYKKYLQDKEEIMAWANGLIHDLYIKQGLDRDQVLAFLRSPYEFKKGNTMWGKVKFWLFPQRVSDIYSMYLHFLKKDDPAFKRMMKYAYQYAEKTSLERIKALYKGQQK